MSGVVDVHTHVLPRELVDLLASGEGPAGVSVRRERDGQLLISHLNGVACPAQRAFGDIDAKLAQMDRDGIETSIVSTSPSLFFYWLDSSETVDICRLINDSAARMARESDGRIQVMATVPMNDPAAAATELRRAHSELGMVGAQIGTSVGSRQLDSPDLEVFFAVADELRVPLMLHPYLDLVTDSVPASHNFNLGNVIAGPAETLMVASRLIVGGVLDRHPDLRFLLVNGGGAFPFQLGWLNFAYWAQEETRAVARRPPIEYLENFLFDSVVFDPKVLNFLVDKAGAERVMFGTNAPLTIGSSQIEEVRDGFAATAAGLILGGNARRVFGLEPVASVAVEGLGSSG